ncbi:MAG: hypothetical protein MJZ64_03325 [Paludibacteraceae bacterium]|nr:hypothetical protein [Paludibacteraceae bacterium]
MSYRTTSWLIVMLMLVVCIGCKNKRRSSVPDYPVNIEIDLLTYPHFIPDNGFKVFLPPFTQSFKIDEYIGYAGVVVWVNTVNQYRAADLCCPHCLLKDKPVKVDGGFYAVCPTCGEEYDLSVAAFPTKGIANEPLRPYDVEPRYQKILIRN